MKRWERFTLCMLLCSLGRLTAAVNLENIPWWEDFEIDPAIEYTAFYCKQHEYDGGPVYWKMKWFALEEPGTLLDTVQWDNGWFPLNSKAFNQGTTISWTGWNSHAEVLKVSKKFNSGPTNHIDVEADGNTGPQLDSAPAGIYLPTWRDGAEAAYVILHSDFGKYDIDSAVAPAQRVLREFPGLEVGWAMSTALVDNNELAHAKMMVDEGFEFVSQSVEDLSVADLWYFFNHGDTVSGDHKYLPASLSGLVVDTTYAHNWETLKRTVEITVGGTTFTKEFSYEVADYVQGDSASSGFIKGNTTGWSDEAMGNVKMFKLYISPGLETLQLEENYFTNSRLYIEKHLGTECLFFKFPYNQYEYRHFDLLSKSGYIGALSGSHCGLPNANDFYHPYLLNYDGTDLIDWNGNSSGELVAKQQLGLQQLVEYTVGTKGCMIREFGSVVNVGGDPNKWEECKKYGENAIPEYLYREHLDMVNELQKQHKLALMKPSELVQYRKTADAVKALSIEPVDTLGRRYVIKAELDSLEEKYQGEISVIVKLDTPIGNARPISFGSFYSDNAMGVPKREPRKMDDEGKAWSVSFNPFKGDVEFGYSSGMIDNVSKTEQFAQAFSMNVHSGMIRLSLPAGEFTATLLTLQGKELLSQSMHTTLTNNTYAMATSSFASGVYLLQIESGGVNLLTRKINLK